MNKIEVVYPSDYTEEDKAEYDMLMSMGKNSIGSTIDSNQAFLIDLAVKMTIREKKGDIQNLSPEEVEKMREIHNEHLKNGLIVETPPNEFYASLLSLKEDYVPPEVKKDIDEQETKIKEDWVKIVDKPNIPVIDEESETAGCDCCGA